jgi:hypothetical protein
MAEISTPAAESMKPSVLPKILVSGFITTIVVVETLIFFFMVPSADDVAALAEARLIDKVEASMEKQGEEQISDEDAIKEFSLGEYGIVFIPPGSDRTYRVEFRLFGTVKAKDEKKLEMMYAERKGRFHHRMMLEVRNATMDELTENQLGLIQRRILATSNEILGEEPILLGVGFNDYQLVEE